MDLELSIAIDLDDGDTSLHMASALGDTKTIREILETDHGKTLLNLPVKPFNSTPLRLACSAGQAESVQELLKYGAHINTSDIKHQTPLFVAVHRNHIECCKLLLQAGANPDGNRGNLLTPLNLACSRGFAPIVQLLLQTGASEKRSLVHPIQLAAISGHLSCYILLLLHGITPRVFKVTNYPQSILPVLMKKDDPMFLELWVLFGGSLTSPSEAEQEEIEAAQREVLLKFRNSPLSLQSQCRIQIWRMMRPNVMRRLPKLDLPNTVIEFLAYRDIPAVYNLISKLKSVLKTDNLWN